MKNLEPEICRQIGITRRRAGISQSAIAREFGCKQSAISMFEQGDGTKLNDAVIEKIAKKFGISLEMRAESVASTNSIFQNSSAYQNSKGYCPNPHCPSNHPYQVEGRIYFLPHLSESDPVGGKFCALCGEVLEKRCPNCGAAVHVGAVCSLCGEPYVCST